MDGMTVLRYRKTMGENLEEDRQRKRGGLVIFSGIHFLPRVKEESVPFFFSQQKCRIADRQLHSSYMQIPLDSAKLSPWGANFKVRLGEKERPEESLRMCQRAKAFEWDAARRWTTLNAIFLWRCAKKGWCQFVYSSQDFWEKKDGWSKTTGATRRHFLRDWIGDTVIKTLIAGSGLLLREGLSNNTAEEQICFW